MADNFGERAATTAEITAWVTLVRAGKSAARGYTVRAREDDRRDSMRPDYGTSHASHEGEE